MFTSTLLTALLAFGASALPTIPLSERDSSTDSGLVERDNWSDTRNDLIDGGCKPVTVIFARGTIELGNVGTLAGPPFFNALTDMIGDSNVAVQGVDYAASIEGYLEGGDPEGASTMASLINQAVSQCPSTQIVISGYSQGAQVAHLAAQQISANAATHISAAIFFGDPDDGQSLQNIASNKDITYCLDTDLICDGLPIVLLAHLSYALDAEPAASMVAGLVQV